MNTIDLILLGAGGGAQDVMDIVDAINADAARVNVVGVLDDHAQVGGSHLGMEILGPLARSAEFAQAKFISTIHNERDYRRHPEIIAGLKLAPDRYATLIHPRAGVSRRTEIAHGVSICDGALIAGGVSIGEHVSVGSGAIVGHDTRLAPHCVLAPGALVGGRVEVGSACYIGSHAAIRPELVVGSLALVGLGAVVVRDVPAETVVVGNPARPREPGGSLRLSK